MTKCTQPPISAGERSSRRSLIRRKFAAGTGALLLLLSGCNPLRGPFQRFESLRLEFGPPRTFLTSKAIHNSASSDGQIHAIGETTGYAWWK